MKIKFAETPTELKLIDEETGVQFFEKYYEARMAMYRSDGYFGVNRVFVFRDIRYQNKDGNSDIEFYARRIERTDIPVAERGPYVQGYGYEIDIDEFNDCFAEYANNQPEKLEQVSSYVKELLERYMGTAKEKNIQFKKGVNHPRKKYGLVGSIVDDIEINERIMKSLKKADKDSNN